MYRMLLRILSFRGLFANFGAGGISRCFGDMWSFRRRIQYSTRILQFCYPSVDMCLILLHVEFEDGLSISVLKDRATRYERLELEIVKFLKKSKVFKRRYIRATSCKSTAVGVRESSAYGKGKGGYHFFTIQHKNIVSDAHRYPFSSKSTILTHNFFVRNTFFVLLLWMKWQGRVALQIAGETQQQWST
jgi:hypothetical protein